MPRTVLVVDDESAIVRLVRHHLEEADFRVITAPNGELGFQAIEREMPDLVITDDVMPVLDGFGLLGRMKKHVLYRDIPVIMIAQGATDPEVFRGWQSGVDCYLTKPFNPMELVQFARTTLRSLDG